MKDTLLLPAMRDRLVRPNLINRIGGQHNFLGVMNRVTFPFRALQGAVKIINQHNSLCDTVRRQIRPFRRAVKKPWGAKSTLIA